MGHRVVITGVGIVSPLGIGRESYWQALRAGVSGIGPITRFDASAFATQIAGEVRDFEPGDYMDKKEARRMDRFAQFAVAAAVLAQEDAGLTITGENAWEMGSYISSGIGGMETLESQCAVLMEKGPGRVSPFLVPMMIGNMAAGQIAIRLGLKGPSSDIVTACASSTQAIGDAARVIERGDASVMFAGGSEASITPLAIAGFNAARALSTRNDDPKGASRPFDRGRDGFVMGEGGAVLVLESLEHAVSRGAKIYAEVKGYATTNDAYHVTAPQPEAQGAIRCMQRALADAGLVPEDIDYINAHGTSTDLNDRLETTAIRQVFGAWADRLAVNSTKSMIGHLLGAAGAAEVIATVLSMGEGELHPTINLEENDPDCDLDYVAGVSRKASIRAALKNSLGFGGHNCCLVIARLEP